MNCIIQHTHKKLLEIHRLWHQSYDNYFDPEGFRTNINATIQAVRNLTFALQNEKDKIKEFESWYSNWQSRMKEDKVMKWLNEARVKIVHQKDLETKSYARVLIHSYYKLVEYTFDVPALLPSELIAKQSKDLIKKEVNIPEYQIKDCIAVVERKWVAVDLPEWEILNALAYGFNFVKNIVIEAHHLAGMEYCECLLHDSLHLLSKDEITGVYSCMEESIEFRTQKIDLSNFKERHIEEHPVKLNEQLITAARKRYSSKIVGQVPQDYQYNPIKFAEYLNKTALNILKKDKYHLWIQFIRVPFKGWELRSLMPEDKADKFLMMKEVAQFVNDTKADCLINISEAWVSSDLEAISQGTPVSETENRSEALCVSLITRDGKSKNYITKFHRNFVGNIKLSETIITDDKPDFFLSPILEVWEETS